MTPLLYRASTQIKFQAPVTLFLSGLLAVAIWLPRCSGVDLGPLDRATYITLLGAVSSILALFCSLSIAWILFVSQQNKAERLATYDIYKARLLQAQQWLLEQEASDDRELCLSLIWELDKHNLSDLPQTDLGEEYRAYAEALESAFNGEDVAKRRFFSISVGHFGYIEQLLSRIGLVSIKQIIAKIFLDTFAKGISLICLAVVTLVASSVWYSDSAKLWFVFTASFIAIGSVLLLVEIFVDISRYYNEELDFVENTSHNEADA